MILRLPFILIFSITTFFTLYTTSHAQNQPVTTGDYFDVELSLETQSPWTKSIPIVVRFKSNITAKKVEISWDSPDGMNVVRRHPQFVSVKKGEVYSYRALIRPTRPGTFTIAGNIIAWEVDTNYSSSSSISINLDDDLVTVPQTPGYSGSVLIKSGILFILIIGGFVGLYYILRIGLLKLKEWLQPPE